MINALNHVSDPMFILLSIMTVCIICTVVISKIFQECRTPEVNSIEELLQFFKIEEYEEGIERFFYIKIVRRNFIFFKTYEVTHEKFVSKEEAEKFLFSKKHVSVKNSLYTIRMVYKLRLLKRLSEMKVA